MASVFLAHPASLEHDTGGHPEQAARITAIEQQLSQVEWLGFERLSSPRVEPEVLTAVHPGEYVAMIEGILRRDRDAVEQAEAHRTRAGGVMTRRSV